MFFGASELFKRHELKRSDFTPNSEGANAEDDLSSVHVPFYPFRPKNVR